ncbi:unnamed protein product, partial [Urochloa humidicola]
QRQLSPQPYLSALSRRALLSFLSPLHRRRRCLTSARAAASLSSAARRRRRPLAAPSPLPLAPLSGSSPPLLDLAARPLSRSSGAAFRAPVGGVLFALEEVELLWRAFFSTATVVVILRGLAEVCRGGR